jgi:hypothetical protein
MPDTGSELPLLTREAIVWLLRLTSGEATVEDASKMGQAPPDLRYFDKPKK